MPAPPDSEPGVEVPPEVRLSEARRAAETFSARLARLERERAQARAGGVADTAELDRVIEVVRRRLQIAELAERAILAEMGAQH